MHSRAALVYALLVYALILVQQIACLAANFHCQTKTAVDLSFKETNIHMILFQEDNQRAAESNHFSPIHPSSSSLSKVPREQIDLSWATTVIQRTENFSFHVQHGTLTHPIGIIRLLPLRVITNPAQYPIDADVPTLYSCASGSLSLSILMDIGHLTWKDATDAAKIPMELIVGQITDDVHGFSGTVNDLHGNIVGTFRILPYTVSDDNERRRTKTLRQHRSSQRAAEDELAKAEIVSVESAPVPPLVHPRNINLPLPAIRSRANGRVIVQRTPTLVLHIFRTRLSHPAAALSALLQSAIHEADSEPAEDLLPLSYSHTEKRLKLWLRLSGTVEVSWDDWQDALISLVELMPMGWDQEGAVVAGFAGNIYGLDGKQGGTFGIVNG